VLKVKGKYLELRLDRLEMECGEEDLQDILNNPTLKLISGDLEYSTGWAAPLGENELFPCTV
jgi:hypothetical protein